eukprot:3225959-Rhodomonas_salina.5
MGLWGSACDGSWAMGVGSTSASASASVEGVEGAMRDAGRCEGSPEGARGACTGQGRTPRTRRRRRTRGHGVSDSGLIPARFSAEHLDPGS